MSVKPVYRAFNIDPNQETFSLEDFNLSSANALMLSGTKIKKIPEGIILDGDVDIDSTKKLKRLPLIKGIHTLYARWSFIEKLPEGLKINGDLDLEGTRFLKKLPLIEGVKNLALNSSGVEEFPVGMKISGSINLEYSKIKTLKNLPLGTNSILLGVNLNPEIYHVLDAFFKDLNYDEWIENAQTGNVDKIRDIFNDDKLLNDYRGNITSNKFEF